MATRRRLIGGALDVREARAAVREILAGRSDGALPIAELLTTEVVTNAVVHSGGVVEITISLSDEALRVSVADGTVSPPVVRPASGEREGGRGMAIVDALATTWGVESTSNGKRVWFQLDLGGAPS